MLTDESTKVSVPPSGIEAPGMGVLPYILLPLAGPEEFDLDDQEKLPDALQFLPPTKAREQDSALRLMHVETLLLLCHTRWGRDFLREHGVYEIIRATHMVEKEDKISEHIERLVNLLHGDEPSYDIDTDLDVAAAANAATVTTSVDASAVKQQDPESDDEDSRIEEV
ncbi:hypothetical protein C8J56DRAFT_77461 [Mycena floridula]|nr:hypothetical protein C8J56DRAFT_77461 [Mycena floridula]